MSPAHLTMTPTISFPPHISPRSNYSYSSTPNSPATGSLTADLENLYRLLVIRDTTIRAMTEAVEEYAWRAMLRGTRVSDWCEGLGKLLDDVSYLPYFYMDSLIINRSLWPVMSMRRLPAHLLSCSSPSYLSIPSPFTHTPHLALPDVHSRPTHWRLLPAIPSSTPFLPSLTRPTVFRQIV
jgi:hypothetical protein